MNNPAGRLRYWLMKADEIAGGTVALTGWAEVFGLDEDSSQGKVEVIGRGAALMDLASETRRQMDKLPEHFHADALMADFDEVEAALSQFVNLPRITMQAFFQPLQRTGWRSLQFADLHLSTQLPERWIPDDRRDDLLKRVLSLIDSVMESDDLTDEDKKFIVKRLREVQDALIEAAFHGVEDVESAVDSLFAGILRRLGFDFFRSDLGVKIGGLIVLVATALGMGSDYLAITDGSGTPVIENTVDVSVDVENNDATAEDESDVVDGEIVDDDGKDERPAS